ncbi:MAG: class I SAM-dependent methyltransferase [Candidatus Omnitrophica bacterium]|nr:class I SAM-dependent methyltransferase [Candidatus Omnitrophota bacterium]
MAESNQTIRNYARGWSWGEQHCRSRSRIKPYWYALRNPIASVISYYKQRGIPLKRMLEVGCGGGNLGIRFSLHKIDAFFIDASLPVLKVCQDNMGRVLRFSKQHSSKSAVVCQDMFHLGFKDQVFDLVVSEGVFEHLHEKEARMQFLRESMRVVKKGGCVFVCIPNNAHPFVPYWKRKGCVWLNKELNPQYYEIEFSGDDLKNELIESGLRDVVFDGCYLWDCIARHPSTLARRMLTCVLKACVPEMTRRFRLRYALMVWAIGRK